MAKKRKYGTHYLTGQPRIDSNLAPEEEKPSFPKGGGGTSLGGVRPGDRPGGPPSDPGPPPGGDYTEEPYEPFEPRTPQHPRRDPDIYGKGTYDPDRFKPETEEPEEPEEPGDYDPGTTGGGPPPDTGTVGGGDEPGAVGVGDFINTLRDLFYSISSVQYNIRKKGVVETWKEIGNVLAPMPEIRKRFLSAYNQVSGMQPMLERRLLNILKYSKANSKLAIGLMNSMEAGGGFDLMQQRYDQEVQEREEAQLQDDYDRFDNDPNLRATLMNNSSDMRTWLQRYNETMGTVLSVKDFRDILENQADIFASMVANMLGGGEEPAGTTQPLVPIEDWQQSVNDVIQGGYSSRSNLMYKLNKTGAGKQFLRLIGYSTHPHVMRYGLNLKLFEQKFKAWLANHPEGFVPMPPEEPVVT